MWLNLNIIITYIAKYYGIVKPLLYIITYDHMYISIIHLKPDLCIISSLPLTSHKISPAISVILIVWTLMLTFLRKYNIVPEKNSQLSIQRNIIHTVYMKMSISKMLILFREKTLLELKNVYLITFISLSRKFAKEKRRLM